MTTTSRSSRVLVVSGLQIHPTLSGGNLRSYALANALGRQGFEVFVYSFVGRKPDYLARRPSTTQTWPGGVREFVDRGLFGLLAGYGSYWLGVPPLWLTAYLQAGSTPPLHVLLPRLLREKLAWCDAVVADFPFLYPIFSAGGGRFRVLNTHNIEHHLYEDRGTWRNRVLQPAVRRIELAAAEAADVVVSCCEADQRYFEEHARMRRSLVVPNGIDTQRFRVPGDVRANTRAALGIPDSVKLFLFTASKYGPNQEAFDFLLAFARTHERLLLDRGIHLLVVGNVVAEPIHLPAFTATGKVDVVEPYFAASDAAVNPLATGAGTNVKMGEFMAARLPIVVSSFGARGFKIDDGRTGFVFERQSLSTALAEVRQLFDRDPERLRRIAEDAYAENAGMIDMDECVRPLVALLSAHLQRADQRS